VARSGRAGVGGGSRRLRRDRVAGNRVVRKVSRRAALRTGQPHNASPDRGRIPPRSHPGSCFNRTAPWRSRAWNIRRCDESGRYLNLEVNAGGSAVVAFHFSIAFRCSQASHVSVRVAVYRPLRQWEIFDSDHRGFSEWFTGPIGHDFHVVGTFAQAGRSLTGTLHSLLSNSRLGNCDSGHLHYSAKLIHRPVTRPATRAITLTEYHSVEPGTPITAVVARFGPPPDHESFSPSHTIVDPYPLDEGLTYIRRGHPKQQLCFVGRDGRIVSFGAC
jgi:hypothetical protein